MDLSLDHLRKIIETQDFLRLVGTVENDFFDCKHQPYRLQDGDAAKRELAKDVSSFANAGGGYILIGFPTQKSQTHLSDEVQEARPFDQALIDCDQYQKVISEWVYPAIDGLTIQWFQTTEADKGVAIITVPAQNERVKPFLITKTLDGAKRVETVFGYAQRRSDATNLYSAADLQRALRSGFAYEGEISRRLNNLEEMVERIFTDRTDAAEAEAANVRIQRRINFALEHEVMHRRRLLVLVAYPRGTGELLTVFSDSEGSIRRSLEHPPQLRHGGWDLGTLDQARIIKGELIRVANGDRKVLDLYRDGTLIFGGLARSNFLAWGENDLRLHALALVEVVYSFARFYELVLADYRQPPGEIVFRIELRNMHLDSQTTVLSPYSRGSVYHATGHGAREAPESTMCKEIASASDGYDPATVAALLVKELYHWFGHDEEKIPYMRVVGGVRQIDTEQIASIR